MADARRILLTGCNGQLGNALQQIYGADPAYELVCTDVADLDITDLGAVKKLINEKKPYAVVNCAAYTNVDGCETNEELAFRINAIGPRNLAIASKEAGAVLVHISTDYVFPGNGSSPCTEDMMPSPKSAYGRTKLAGENFVRDFADAYYIIRTAWLYGEGKNFVRTMLRIAEDHDKVSVVDDQLGNPTSAMELARAIYRLIPTGSYGIYHGTCEGICSWADFAEEIFRLSGKKVEVEHISSREYKRRFPASADRPAYSALDNRMFRLTTDIRFADWQDAIREYMEQELRK